VPDINDVYDSEAEQERLREILEARYQTMLRAVHEAVRRVFGLTREEFRLPDRVTNVLLMDAARRVAGIDETTRQAIAEQLRIGQELGLSTWEIANGNPEIEYRGIQGLFEETYKGRAETIARTELQHAQVESAMNRYAATGMVDYVQIIDGDDWDIPCAERNGKIVPISERPQLNHPNCTLALVPVMREGIV
jgi:cell division ATPase FtsA